MKRHQAQASPRSAKDMSPPFVGSSWRVTGLAAGLILLSAVAAYHNSFRGPFIYDDLESIVENETIRQLWPIWQVLSPPPHGETVSGRPLLNLSWAINYALGGLNVWDYHATNLAIHIAAALLLLGILRRTFLLPALRDRFGSAATPLALASALIWTVHPLQTESVTYIVQRAESLAGFFYLLTLYCVIRGAGTVPFFAANRVISPSSVAGEKGDCPPMRLHFAPLFLWERLRVRAPGSVTSALNPALSQREREILRLRPRLWYAAAILACLLGMATKEIMVTAPLVVLLYDRTFLAGSFAEAWRRRGGLYLGLAATWALLVYLVCSTGSIARRPEMAAADPWNYARSQPGVILHYLRLSLWPSPLCLHYGWSAASGLREIVPGLIVTGALLAATVWGLLGRKVWAFLGAWFFLILAPTSSILPLGQLAFEHRMYLPLGAVAVLTATGGYALWDRLLSRCERGRSPFAPEAMAGGIGSCAAKKERVPGLAIVRWAAPVMLLAALLLALGDLTAARNSDYRCLLAIWQDTVDKRPQNPTAHNNLGNVLAGLGRPDEALQHYRLALRLRPDYAEAYSNLGNALADLGRTDEALEHYRQALLLRPDDAEVYYNLGIVLAAVGRTSQAVEHYQQALRLKPDYAEAHNNLAALLAATGSTNEAIEHLQQGLRLKPDSVEIHNNLAAAYAAAGRFDDAALTAERAVQLAESSGQAVLAKNIQSRLELYRASRAHRQPRNPGP